MGLSDIKFMVREEQKAFGSYMTRREILDIIMESMKSKTEKGYISTKRFAGFRPTTLTYLPSSAH